MLFLSPVSTVVLEICKSFATDVNKIDSTLLKKVFTTGRDLGFDLLCELCDTRILTRANLQEISETISQLHKGDGDSIQEYNVDWLFELSDEDLTQIKNGILQLKEKKQNILNALKSHDGTEQHIEVGKIGSYRLFAINGQIVCNNSWFNYSYTKLIESFDYLLMCKDSLNELYLHKLMMPTFKLSDANFAGSDLREADLHSATLCRANLSKTDLRGADLRGADLEEADLSSVMLSSCKMDADTNLHRTKIILSTDSVLQLSVADHIHFINLIDNIPAKYLNQRGIMQKIDLMHQMIDAYRGKDFSHIHDALMNTFMNNSIYVDDQKIRKFIKDTILPLRIESKNTSKLDVRCEAECRLRLDMALELTGSDQNDFMIGNNGYFVQLIALCTTPDLYTSLIPDAEKLYNQYLNLECVRPFKTHLEREITTTNENIEIDDADKKIIFDAEKVIMKYSSQSFVSSIGTNSGIGLSATFLRQNVTEIDDDDLALLFFAMEDRTATSMGLLVSRNRLRDMLTIGSAHDWKSTYFIRGKTVAPLDSFDLLQMKKVFSKHFPLFKTNYEHCASNSSFAKLFDTIDFNQIQKSANTTFKRNYRQLFEEALSQTTSSVKLVEESDQAALREIFGSVLVPNQEVAKKHIIHQAHFDAICEIYCLGASDEIKAYVLICVGAFFTQYSSAKFFGTENDSPFALRIYVVGLLNKAAELCPTLIGKTFLEEWLDMLTGHNGKFSCTNALSHKMIEYIKTHDKNHPGLMEILETLKPLPWY